MKLIDILVSELPNLGGWPDGVIKMSQDYDGEVWCWRGHGYGNVNSFARISEIADNHRKQSQDEELSCFVTREQYEAALAACKPEWDGEGLPPSGVEFEYLRGEFGADEGRWVKCVMKYAGERFCIVHIEEVGESWLKHEGTKIRPIRSEADKNRDASIQEMIELIDSLVGERANPVHGKKAVAEKFYDAIAAGKIPHIRID